MAASLSSGDKGTVERTLNELLNQDCKSVHLWHDHELKNTVCMYAGGSDADCKGLLGVLKAHPELAAKVAEVLASFAKEGRPIIHTTPLVWIYLLV